MRNYTKKILLAVLMLTLLSGAITSPLVVRASGTGTFLNNAANQVGQSILASLGQMISQVLAQSAYSALWLSSWILTLVGLLFDEVLKLTVVNLMATLGSSNVINTLWADVRSLGNIVFIFMAIYVSIKTIIGQGGDDTKRLIRNLIIVALLVNFSLFFTKLLIDGSNIFTLAFYNLTLSTGTGTNATINGLHAADSFSTVFAKPLGLSTIYTFSKAGDASTTAAVQSLAGLSFGTIILVGIGGSFFLLTTAVTFGFVAVLFITRYVLLILLMILSPLAFLFFALPSTQEQASKWWRMLAGQLIFGIVYMLLIWFVALIVNNGGFKVTNLVSSLLTPNGQVANATGFATVLTSGSGIDQILFFLIIIGLMVAALYLAVRAASYGNTLVGKAVGLVGGAVSTTTKYVGGKAASGAAALGGKAYRGTVGAAAEKLTGEGSKYGEQIRGMKTSTNVFARALGRQLDKRATQVREASGDVRNLESVKNFSTKTGLDIGKGKEGGYKARVEAEEKEFVDYAKTGGAATQKTMDNLRESRGKLSNARLELAKHIATAQEISEERLDAKLDKQKIVDPQTQQQRSLTNEERQAAKQAERKRYQDRRDKLSTTIRNTETDIKKIEKTRDNERRAGQAGLLTNWNEHSTRVSLLSNTHKASVEGAVDRFLTKEKVADKGAEDKERIEGYADRIRDAIAAGDEKGIQAAVESVPEKDLSKLPKDARKGGFKYLPEHVQKNFLKSKDLSEADRNELKDTLTGAANQTAQNQANTNNNSANNNAARRTAEEARNRGERKADPNSTGGEYDVNTGPVPPKQPPQSTS